MREIKFRAFHKGEMRDVICIDWLNRLVDLVGGFIEIPFKDVELMQYTGIKDVTGVSIYEGDVIEEAVKGSYHGLVEYHRGKWWCEGDSLDDASRYCKVIGNKFENPELLSD